jgi:hypothetical protein
MKGASPTRSGIGGAETTCAVLNRKETEPMGKITPVGIELAKRALRSTAVDGVFGKCQISSVDTLVRCFTDSATARDTKTAERIRTYMY